MFQSIHRLTQNGFALLALIGILAVLTILGSIIVPNMVAYLNQETRGSEKENLAEIARAVQLYLRKNLSWPATLSALTPDYVTLDAAQLTQNPRGYPRYFFVHPNTNSFNNGAGLAGSSLPDLRFLLISDLRQDAAPTITNATEFETWWATDPSGTPDLHLHRGNVAPLLPEVTLSGTGGGGVIKLTGPRPIRGERPSRITTGIISRAP